MVKDEDVCVHCGLCAEDVLQEHGIFKFSYTEAQTLNSKDKKNTRKLHNGKTSNFDSLVSKNDFVIKFANVNGSGSASANQMFAKAVFRMGVPVSPKIFFPQIFKDCLLGLKSELIKMSILGVKEVLTSLLR